MFDTFDIAIAMTIAMALLTLLLLPRFLPKNFMINNGVSYVLLLLPFITIAMTAMPSIFIDIGAKFGLISLEGLFSYLTVLYMAIVAPIIYVIAIIIGTIQVLFTHKKNTLKKE